MTNGLFRQSNICSQAGFSKNQCSLLDSCLRCTLVLGTTVATVNHVDVKTPDKRLARGEPVLSREKSTPSMMKHLELRSSENCLDCDRAFRTQMIALKLVFTAEDCFHDLLCLIFNFYWFCSIIASNIVVLLRSSLFPSLAYTLVLLLPRQ